MNIRYFLDFLELFYEEEVNKKSTKVNQKSTKSQLFKLTKVTEKVNLDKIDFFSPFLKVKPIKFNFSD